MWLHLTASKPTPKSPTPKHHFKQMDFNFLHPTATHATPKSVTDLHLASHSFSKFLAWETAAIAESFNSVALDKSISTKLLQFKAKPNNPEAEKG